MSTAPVPLQVLDYINKRQAELESERKELTAYQALDKQRRALEYALCDMELNEVKVALEKVRSARPSRPPRFLIAPLQWLTLRPCAACTADRGGACGQHRRHSAAYRGGRGCVRAGQGPGDAAGHRHRQRMCSVPARP